MPTLARWLVPAVSFICAGALLLPRPVGAQQPTGRVVVRVQDERGPVEGAQVASGRIGGLTDENGRLELTLPVGPAVVEVSRLGYAAASATVTVSAGGVVEVDIRIEEAAIEADEIIVTSTRADRRIEDEPLRVEVIAREEVEEKLLMTPGDIAMLLNETAGLRVQPTAPSLGGASVRIQGLRGRYTQLLSDGLPLYGGQSGALGPLQIPPLDLGQVEVIKGVASALYGASALGGVVNLISRRPLPVDDREILLNQTTLGGTDGIFWSAEMLGERLGYTFLASGHRQARADVDEDGWADLPAFRRGVVRPRLFWNDGRGGAAFVTVGGMIENREGGTLPGRTTPAGDPFREALETRRLDAGTAARFLVGQAWLVSVRASGALQTHDHGFGEVLERDRHGTGFAEGAVSGTDGAHSWLVGGAIQADRYDARSLEGFDHTRVVPGLFVQDEWEVSRELTLSGSGRLDHHDAYGTFFNPRLSALIRLGDAWTIRTSGGTGFFAPTPWTEETEAIGLSRLNPPTDLEAERAQSGSIDVGRALGPFELNFTGFASAIENPVQLRAAAGDPSRVELFNAEGEVRTWGTEALARFEREGLHLTATHVYTLSTEPNPEGEGRREVPLTPRHAIGLVAAWEQEGRGRVGAEFYFTGRQDLENNPYRARSRSYAVAGFLVERRFGRARVFLNAENVFDERQTRHDPLLLPSRSPEGRWITDVWAPLEGRAFNLGLRWTLRGE